MGADRTVAKILINARLKRLRVAEFDVDRPLVAKSKVVSEEQELQSRGITSTTGTEGRQRCQIDPLARRPDINLSG